MEEGDEFTPGDVLQDRLDVAWVVEAAAQPRDDVLPKEREDPPLVDDVLHVILLDASTFFLVFNTCMAPLRLLAHSEPGAGKGTSTNYLAQHDVNQTQDPDQKGKGGWE